MRKIIIIGTGGTIAGQACSATEMLHYTSAVFSIDSLIEKIPEITSIADIVSVQLSQVDSCDMTYELLLTLATRINEMLASSEVDGIVITHGTDTLEETAYFLNLVIKSNKPVVVVGAMRPFTAMSGDGPMNLYNAVSLAASNEAMDKGVLVSLNDTIYCSREVVKAHTMRQDSFRIPDFGCLGYVQGGKPYFYRLPVRKHTIFSEFNVDEKTKLPQVDILLGYLNSSPFLAQAAVNGGAKGIVYAGLGNGGMSQSIKNALANMAEKGIPIVRSTRVSSGIVTRNGAVDDDQYSFVAADTLSPQKARILLTLALTKTSNPAIIQQMFWEY